MDKYSALDSQSYGPSFDFEYNTREAYGRNIPWGANDPLNATWWHLVTERECRVALVSDLAHACSLEMETNSSLVSVCVLHRDSGKVAHVSLHRMSGINTKAKALCCRLLVLESALLRGFAIFAAARPALRKRIVPKVIVLSSKGC